ncbi:TIGR03619 family F420-dependent LLM class oxidoreductase [Rhodococcus sp. HNM0569]|uniref:TIGR03619 family F420-dependent LLM class oxidoreductase n=1 Tax=Rhodococcus sp. HNM0569 TaxID=2716340 RepID=UPI00146D19CC|nr:TIGR03619 family F420-dependent LLM class oxidoreductase [Rhodococcus sp. HNM0569]NLU81641.1 TIGR03619 family F420-dependent LLM class oxidoreductase [Rhodococcus sp. HNM0569]
MRIGINTPIVTAHPQTCAEWERSAGPAELRTIAATADRLGYHHLTCSEHVAIPAHVASERGGTYWDPLATLSYLAAATDRIRLATLVVVLGYHHPLALAKSYGTLDVLSGGRTVLGVGVGTLREEFDLLGAPFDDRGARADDALAALRRALGRREPSYHGTFFEFDDMVVEPHAPRTHVPVWVGGRTKRSLRRAVEHGDGWVPFGLRTDELTTMLGGAALPTGFDVVLSANLDPTGDPDRVHRALDRLRALGATIVKASVHAESAEHYTDQLHSLRDLATEHGSAFGDH